MKTFQADLSTFKKCQLSAAIEESANRDELWSVGCYFWLRDNELFEVLLIGYYCIGPCHSINRFVVVSDGFQIVRTDE